MRRCGGEFFTRLNGRGWGSVLRPTQGGIKSRLRNRGYLKLRCELETGHKGDHACTIADNSNGGDIARVQWIRRREP